MKQMRRGGRGNMLKNLMGGGKSIWMNDFELTKNRVYLNHPVS